MTRQHVGTALGLAALLAITPTLAQGQQPGQAPAQPGQPQPGGGGAAQRDDGQLAQRVAQQIAQALPQAKAEEGGLLARGWKVRGTGDLEVDVKVDEGDVTLSGQLASIDQVRRAVEAARKVPGVQSVRSEVAFYVGVPRDRLRSYVDALQRMAQSQPDIRQAMQQGQPVGADLLDRVPAAEAQKAMDEAKLSQEEFRRITTELQKDQSLQQQYAQIAQQQAQRSGAQQPGGPGARPAGQSGAQPAASPQ